MGGNEKLQARSAGRRLASPLAILVPVLFAGPAAAASLLIEARGFAPDGMARVAVFSSRVSFPEQPRFSAEATVDAGGVRLEVPDLPSGDYAVLVWEDRNGNGELDRSMFGAPQEPYGFSNGVRDKRPQWEDVRVTLGPEPLPVAVQVE